MYVRQLQEMERMNLPGKVLARNDLSHSPPETDLSVVDGENKGFKVACIFPLQ